MKRRKIYSLITGALFLLASALSAGIIGNEFQYPESLLVSFAAGVLFGIITLAIWLAIYGEEWGL